ncbi:hypothetical protein [Chryseobacterium sp. FH1]|uniref:hypothetical protein n=1 Tax=Chryseobacterium sp. FH1 TaxID=1233951 RepID=UPI000AC0CECA|nr:hypothetical protein [Chryseobacterium sp. FH1]
MTNVKSYYRNIEDLISIEGIFVKKQSLWYRENGIVILENPEIFATAGFNHKDFLYA